MVIKPKYVKEAFDTNWVVPIGSNINAFKQDLANFANNNSDRTLLDRKAKTDKYPKVISPITLYGMPYRGWNINFVLLKPLKCCLTTCISVSTTLFRETLRVTKSLNRYIFCNILLC